MDSTKLEDEIDFEYPGFVRVYKDGRAESDAIIEFIPPSTDPSTGVSSKDIVIDPKTGLSARLYLPPQADDRKFPLMIYFHGSGFVVESAFSPLNHPYVNSLVAEANVVAISVEYRKAPEHLLPTAYEDCWSALQWVAAQSQSQSQSKDQKEEWFERCVDFERVFMVGDSSGGNIVHNMAIRVGMSDPNFGLKIDGIVMIHSYFLGEEIIEGERPDDPILELGRKTLKILFPSSGGLDNPAINPIKEPNLSRLGCRRVLLCVAEKDAMVHRGRSYYEALRTSGWSGAVELIETQGEDHAFHVYYLTSQKARELIKRVASFMNATDVQ